MRWDDPEVESMYDKTLLRMEIDIIKSFLKKDMRICDFGCGEGEGTAEYFAIPGVKVDAFDISTTRLAMATKRCHANFMKWDILLGPRGKYDAVISQRLLINLKSREDQRKAITHLSQMVDTDGMLILSEGSTYGVDCLNRVRQHMELPEIPIPEHNLFIGDHALTIKMQQLGFRLRTKRSMGAYYLLTRGIQPAINSEFHWDSPFNRLASKTGVQESLKCDEFSRVKIWMFQR